MRRVLGAAAPVPETIVLPCPARVFDGVELRPHDGWSVLVRGSRIVEAGPGIVAPPG